MLMQRGLMVISSTLPSVQLVEKGATMEREARGFNFWLSPRYSNRLQHCKEREATLASASENE